MEDIFFPMTQQPPVGQGPSHYRGFTITFRHTHSVRFLWASDQARRREFYLTTYNIYKGQTPTPPAEFEPAFQASERLQTHTLDREATGMGDIT